MRSQSTSISREEQAKAEIGVTAISRRAALSTALAFLATVVSVPLIDQASGGHKLWRRLFAGGDAGQAMRQVEAALEDESATGRRLRPVARTVLNDALAAGTEQVHRGRDGWLFYAPDVRHVTARGFLDPPSDDADQRRNRREPVPRRRDPVAAILHFKSQLDARGVQLVIVPTPVKPMVQPEKLWPRSVGPLTNASFARLKNTLEAGGVLVCDLTTPLAAAAREGPPQFLVTDTHWRPETMDLAARELAGFVNARVALPQSLGIEYDLRAGTLRGRGDLAAMLQLLRPPPLEEVAVQQVIAPDGLPWQPQADAAILWLGDSFSNIYAAEAMGWGASAGFAEQFSRHMGCPVDALRRNDDGAHATRQMLADELAGGNDRLAGKKLVVWQFAARELSFGDWRLIDLTLRDRPARRFIVPPPGQTWRIEGIVAAHGVAPRPGNVAYRDHILAAHLTGVAVEGQEERGEAVVYLRSINDGRLTEAAGLRVGQRVRMDVRDWSDVSRQFQFIRRSDLKDAALRSQTPCWGDLSG